MSANKVPIGQHVILETANGSVVSGTLLAIEGRIATVLQKFSDPSQPDITWRVELADKYFQAKGP